MDSSYVIWAILYFFFNCSCKIICNRLENWRVLSLAQLVKLQDYVSRYQIDLTRYPTQFVRLKKIQWDRIKNQWLSGEEIQKWEHFESTEEESDSNKLFSLIHKFIPKKNKNEEDIEMVEVSNEFISDEEDIPEEETTLYFEPNIVHQPQTLEELKRMFNDQFFQFQLKWASSTLREKSYVDPKFLRDGLLRTILQKLPDNYLIFYYPIVRVKKAPVELDIVILTPTDCLCITVVEEENLAVYVGNSDRFWTKKVGKSNVKILNPMIQLNRMEAIVSNLFSYKEINMPIRKILLSRNGYFDYPGSAFNIQFIDKREFQKWMIQLKHSSSPMKRNQIQAAQVILETVQTTSFNRDIWNVGKSEES